MKKKIFAILLIAVMVLASVGTAFAQTENVGGGEGSITVSNAAGGETYKIYKLFDAIHGNGTVNYSGDIPASLTDYFEKQEGTENGVVLVEGADQAELFKALKAWAATQTPMATVVADGDAVVFDNIPYGYYVITSSQDEGKNITVDSANPDAEVVDKNSKEPTLTKTANDKDVNVGDTVTYTITSDTANFLMQGGESKKVVSYVFTDTTPDFLTDVTVTSITVSPNGEGPADVTKQFTNKQIEIDWVDADGKSLYPNNATITITYTAKVTAQATVGDDGGVANNNIVKLNPQLDNGNGGKEPWEKELHDEERIYTYAAALHKVDDRGNDLAGAKFTIAGIKAKGSAGDYTVSTDADAVTEFECDANGYLIIKGVSSDAQLVATETVAPEGYNKLEGTATLVPQKTSEKIVKSSEITYYDAEGNIVAVEQSDSEEITEFNEAIQPTAVEVVNYQGTVMPATGGMGTTILYIIGAALVLGAGAVLVTRRKADR